jgi:AcrR family transcriptional regulator
MPNLYDALVPASLDPSRRYAGKTTQERRADRRERLFEAALELFGSVGYAATTIEMLCAATRLNPRYFYEEFRTREALLVAVYDRHVEAVLAAVVAALAEAPAEPRARMQAGLSAFVAAVLADERAARINYFEIVGVSPELEAHRRDVLRAYADLIADEIDQLPPDRRPPGTDRRLTAVAFVSATDGLITDWLTTPGDADRGAIVATLVEIFMPE